MRDYLESFFERFGYEREDAVLLLDVYDKIRASESASALWSGAIGLYDADVACDFSELRRAADSAASILGIRENTTELLLLICLTRRLELEYGRRGIENAVFLNTMQDLRYKLEECKLVRGFVGTFVFSWFDRFYNLTRFALGRLQFEIVDFGESYERGGKILTPGSKVINVHIPRSLEPLTPGRCDEAFVWACEFFADKIEGDIAFVCNSWLLYPENEKILSAGSNVYKFMKRFDIIKSSTDADFRHLWRLFDTDEKNPEKLPTDTSMRRAYVEHLKCGGKVGTGKGVFFAPGRIR